MSRPRRSLRTRSAATGRDREPLPPEIADLRNGSDAAWHEAVSILGPPLRGFIGLRGAADPDGTLGDVFLDLARAVDDFNGDWEAFRTLAFVIARRRVIDGIRYSSRRPSDPVDSQSLAEATVGGDVEHEAMDRLTRQWVLELLDTLTPLQRDVLTMRMITGLSIREVAAITGSSEAGVKANQRRAVSALRRHLSESPSTADASRLRDRALVLGLLP